MIDRNKLFSFTLSLLTSSMVSGEAVQCPASSATIQYHSLGRSQIAISVIVNRSGPYEFMVDTGAQVTTVDPVLADELKLEAKGSIGVIAVTSSARVPLVSAAVVEAGPVAVQDLQMVVEGLGQIQAQNPTLRGILGNNFLSRFDLLIDYSRKMLCFDDSHQLQQSVRGERVPIFSRTDHPTGLDYSEPILVLVYLPGDGPEGTVLLVDSGSNVPLLFVDHNPDSLPWLQKSRMMRGSTAGNAKPVSYAVTPMRTMKLTTRLQMHVAFLTPIGDGRSFAKTCEDGLLPTTLFKKVFISYADRFVIFDPR